MPRPQMFLVAGMNGAGMNGAGKSTYTRSIINKFPALKVIDPDAIAQSMTGSYATIGDKQISAGKAALKHVRSYIKEKESFVVESTISGRVYLNYLQQANEAGFKTILIYVALSSAQLSAERVSARVSEGGHGIPLVDIQRRYPKSLNNLHAHIKSSDLAYIYDNSDNYTSVASFRDGTLYRDFHTPIWLAEYLHPFV
ncbi:MAG: hypothetical protein COA42_09975 [Alteromonadaceae bacterium]|nr:MAG: hypothetical protein COA42_09975 [Alteromonadaceae bacterium]